MKHNKGFVSMVVFFSIAFIVFKKIKNKITNQTMYIVKKEDYSVFNICCKCLFVLTIFRAIYDRHSYK